MPIRHSIRHRPTARGITPRRLTAARSALKRERERLSLFAEQVAAEQPTPEERIAYFDQRLLDADQSHRELAAKHWRWARRQLATLSAEVREEIINQWNASSIPPEGHYFADFVRTQFRRRYLQIAE